MNIPSTRAIARGTAYTRHLLAAISVTAALATGSARANDTDTPTVAVDLPAQPLAASLDALAADAGLALDTGAASLSGMSAPALSGDYPLDTALDRLLAGSGLVASLTSTTVADAGT